MTPKNERTVVHIQLEDFLTTLHDRGVVNENALLAVFKVLLDGKLLTLDNLAAIFGVETIFNLTLAHGTTAVDAMYTRTTARAREDFFRAAALQGAASVAMADCLSAGAAVDFAENVVQCLRGTDVL